MIDNLIKKLPGGTGDSTTTDKIDPAQLSIGVQVEMEHTNDPEIAKEIAMDHLTKDPVYYTKLVNAGLAKEFQAGTGSGVGDPTTSLNDPARIGMGGLKYYLLKVDPKKKMLFNPEESIELNGNTGPFIQYAHARICSILRKEGIAYDAPQLNKEAVLSLDQLAKAEKQVVLLLEQYDGLLAAAANEYNPSLVANYCFQLAQAFNTFYDAHSIAHADTEAQKQFRLYLIIQTAHTLKRGMSLLGIEVPSRM